MAFSIPFLLAVFSLLAIASGVYFLAERLRLPYTVLLVAVGTFVLVPLSMLPFFSYLRAFSFTPEMLFYIFLPVLIFESAYNISVRRLMENVWAISILSVVSLIISAGIIGGGLFILLPLLGFEVPFVICALFGALISATDPVAVLSLFKELGAPRRLTLIFEGESIFNDGTAVALFLVILAVAVGGWHGSISVFEGLSTFGMMIIVGIALGLVLGFLFTKAVDLARKSEYVQISLMIVLAHFTFIISDFISQNLVIAGHSIHISAIISTTVASMVMGNYGRSKILPHAREFVEEFWTEAALLVNSLVFLLIGLIFTTISIPLKELLLPIGLAVVVVAVARAVSIYPVVWVMNRTTGEAPIPRSWQHLLAWGSLRGALAVTMVLLIPADLVVEGWNLPYSPRDVVMALTLGCIFVTLFIKATTIKTLAQKMHVNDLTDLEQLQYGEAMALVHAHALDRVTKFREKGYIDVHTADMLAKEHNDSLEKALVSCKTHFTKHGGEIGERVLRLYALGVEKRRLADLYEYGEVSEEVYRRVFSKLTLQYERIEFGSLEQDPAPTEKETWFDSFRHTVKHVFFRIPETKWVNQYMYYRTLAVLSRAALREVKALNQEHAVRLFGTYAVEHIVGLYEEFLRGSTAKMHALKKEEPNQSESLAKLLARKSILEVEFRELNDLYEREMITPKVYAQIKERLVQEADVLEDEEERGH